MQVKHRTTGSVPETVSVAGKGLVLALTACVVLALAFGVTLAQGAKEVADYFGSGPGSLGLQFNTPRDVAVNETGAGAGDLGDIYVVDENNHRIQRFDSDRRFVSAWGADVSQPAGGTDFERCTVAADCKAGNATGGNGTAAGNGALDNPQSIGIDQDTGVVYVSDRDNRRINAYDGDGTFLFAVGRDVQDPDGDLTTEVCGDVGGDVCRAGDGGSGPGDIGATTTAGTLGMAVSPSDGNTTTGTVFLADSQNRRVNTYGLDGQSPASFGSSANFGATQPRKIAIDSRGIVYASDSNSGGQIDRYDSLNANGGGVGFLASIASPPLLAGATATATSGLAVDPDSDGAGTADEDVLYVLRDPSSGNTVVQQFGPANHPGLTTPPIANDDQHGGGAGLGVVTGFGADDDSDRLFVSAITTTVGASGHRVYVLGESPAPQATLDPIADPGATSAAIEGSVDANGAQSGYHFELSADGGTTWTSRPTGGDIPLGAGEDAESVSYTLEGLKPNTKYDVKLVAKQVFASTSGVSNIVTFTTDGAAPGVTPGAVDAGVTSALAIGAVDPSGEATTYRFEYGLTSSYGNTAPVPDGSLTAANDYVPVSATLSGLTPNTAYHYRLVAANSSGTATSADHVFLTKGADAASCPNAPLRKGIAARLPHCRAYEQVSPVDKNGGDIVWQGTSFGSLAPGGRPVSEDGERAMFASGTEFADADYGGASQDTDYLAKRGPDGWTTTSMVPKVTPSGAGRGVSLSSPDLSRSLLRTTGQVDSTPPDTTDDENELYDRENDLGVVTPYLGITTPSAGVFDSPVMSRDWDHLVFGSTAKLTDDPGIAVGGFFKVYEKIGDDIRLASKGPDGAPIPQSTPVPLTSLSDDGRHVFFAGANGLNDPREIYRRTDGTTTTHVSASQRSVPDPVGQKSKFFMAASRAGDRVLFTSAEHLTDDANTGFARTGSDLYLYDFNRDRLVDLSATNDGSSGARVQGIVGASAGLDRVFYTALGQVVPGEGSSSGSAPNLYLWEDDGTPDGLTRFIATLSPADSGNWNLGGLSTARTTVDAARLIFTSGASIPGYDNGAVDQVYRYDLTAADGAGAIDCISCNPAADTPLGGASIPIAPAQGQAQRWELPRALSADGHRVFFNTRDALVPRDSNGKVDAYLWDDGDLSLLTSGTSGRDSHFYNASVTGDDAFVLTAEALVPQDRDALIDLYDVRVGGGFEAPAGDGSCDGDGCQGDTSPAVPAEDLGSVFLDGAGDASPGQRLTLSLRRPSRATLARLADGRRADIFVRVSGPTTVRLRMRGRIAGRSRLIATKRVRTERQSRVRIPVRLSAAALRRLRGGHVLRVTVRVSAAGARTRVISAVLKGTR